MNKKNKLPVLFLLDHIGYDQGPVHGVTTYLVTVMPELRRAGQDSLLCVTRTPHPAALKRLEAVGIHPIFFHCKKFDPRALFHLRKFLRTTEVGLIHVAQQKSMALARVAGAAAEVPVLLHLHDPDRPGQLLQNVHRRYMQPTDRVVGVSREACERAADFHVAPERVEVLHNALDVHQYAARASVARDRVRAELGLHADTPVIGTLSRLFPAKGHRGLLQSLPRILEKIPQLTLLIPGEGPEREPCEQLVRELGIQHAVRFLGQRGDIPEFLSALDLVIIASREEGFPFAGVEAMACGVPVVAYGVGGVPELVRDGRTGLLIRPGDASAMAAAIVDLMSNATLRGQMRAGSLLAAEDFDIRTHIARLQSIYERMSPGAGTAA